MSVYGTGPIAGHNSTLSVVGYGHKMLSVMVTMSSYLNLNFLKMYSPLNVSIKRMGSVPTNLASSQHLRQLKTYKIEQPFLSGILGCIKEEKLLNNLKCV